ncbi:MAG: DNA recombination protein RmuC [Lachnospiraceae bacterium]|nr:DNA recombination protein RmuC [Lachnospiraceae bacterium]
MEIAIIIMLAIAIVLLVLVLLKVSAKDDSRTYVKESEERILNGIANVSDSQNRSFSDVKVAISDTNRVITGNISEQFSDMIRKDAEAQRDMQQVLENRMDAMKGSVGESLKDINEKLVETVKENSEGQKKISDNLSESLLKIQTLTEEKLNGIQKDVNDKLDASLNKRLDESFEKVTNQLTQLYKSLGELGEMSDGISNLNKTLSNVKTRGTWGEIQLGNILEETMTEAQYAKNIKLKKNSDDIVEFAIKIPAREEGDEIIYLPIDSKFPLDIYGNLVDAADSGVKENYDKYVKELEVRIKTEAKSIRDKYVIPPVTTDFAIMFLPTESLYAEVLRINGLAEFCQNKYRVIIASPSTITALLNSLRVGFANVALNKKTAEVRKILEAVKAQYGKLDELIDTTKKKLEAAVTSTDNLKERTRKIQKSMSKIGEIDQKEADNILMIEDGNDE